MNVEWNVENTAQNSNPLKNSAESSHERNWNKKDLELEYRIQEQRKHIFSDFRERKKNQALEKFKKDLEAILNETKNHK